jgi:16S rRNA (cytosine967-C5)-methyltransferase
LALQVLVDGHRHDGFVQEILDRHLDAHPLSPPDRRLATQVVYGVLRRRGTLNALVRPFVHRSSWKTEPWLADALALGAYQLALLTHIPAHAALHETVELASLYGRPSAKGFLNAILHRVAELLTDVFTDAPAADALPVEQGQYRRLRRPALPDPVANPLEYLSIAYALPLWLAERWRQRYSNDECRRLGFWFAGPAPLTLRCNPLCCPRKELLQALAEVDACAESGDHPQALRLHGSASIRDLPGYDQGWFSVQDEAAMRVGSALTPQPGDTILDLCAAPGGKAAHLAELMGNQGRVVACDVDSCRLQIVQGLTRRLGLTIVETHLLEKDGGLPGESFDRALVDAPCSNTGVLGRRPEARWRLRPEDLRHLVTLQRRLLGQALGAVRVGGIVVYSTCSIEPEENRGVVEAVLKEVPHWSLEAQEESSPGRPADGGYWARLRRE